MTLVQFSSNTPHTTEQHYKVMKALEKELLVVPHLRDMWKILSTQSRPAEMVRGVILDSFRGITYPSDYAIMFNRVLMDSIPYHNFWWRLNDVERDGILLRWEQTVIKALQK